MISIAVREAMPQSSVKGRAATENKALAQTNGSARFDPNPKADEHTYSFGKFATLKTYKPDSRLCQREVAAEYYVKARGVNTCSTKSTLLSHALAVREEALHRDYLRSSIYQAARWKLSCF